MGLQRRAHQSDMRADSEQIPLSPRFVPAKVLIAGGAAVSWRNATRSYAASPGYQSVNPVIPSVFPARDKSWRMIAR